MENNARYFEIVWGSQRAGTMLVPISTRLTPPEIAYILRDSEARLLLSSQHFADTVARLRAEMPDLPVLMLGSGGADDLATALATQPDTMIADATAGLSMLYSSGTTGQPKGIRPAPPASSEVEGPVPLAALAVYGAGMPPDGEMVYLSPAPLYHAAPLGWSSICLLYTSPSPRD